MKYFILAAVIIAVVVSAPTTKPCLTICPMNYAPVCGSDGKSYGNQCELESISCQTGGTLIVMNQGACTL